MPSDPRSVRRKADREAWKSRPRAGLGGGREYAILSLPAETRDHLIRTSRVPAATVATPAETDAVSPSRLQAKNRKPEPAGSTVPAVCEATRLPAVQSERERILQPLGDLKDWQRRRMDARLAILMEVDRLARAIGAERAVRTVVSQAESGQLPPEIQQMVPIANARSGRDGGRTLSRRTLYRWLGEREHGQAALAPVAVERRSIPEWVPALLELYRRPTKPSLAWAMEELPKHLPAGATVPSYWQAQRWIKRMPAIERERGRMGPRELRALQPFRRRSTREHWPTDIYTMDGHTFDAEVAHPVHGRPFRPEITSVIDVAARRMVGWSVALSESAWAVIDALRHAAVTHGIPAILYVDNGSGYCNHLLDEVAVGMLARLGISKETSIPYNSQARGLIERAHRSVWIRMAKTLPTYMGADMDKEAKQKVFKITRKQMREQGASALLLSWTQFERLASAAVDAYNSRPHRGLPRVRDQETGAMRHQTPDEAWREALDEGWEPVAVDAAESDDLFRPYIVRKTTRGEISLFGNTYFSKALAEHTGELVRAGYDIHDAQRIWVRDRNDRFICRAEFEANASSYFPVTAIEEAAAKRARGRMVRAERRIEEIEAEHAGILGQVGAGAQATPEEQAAAREALERLGQAQREAEALALAEAQTRREDAHRLLEQLPGTAVPMPIAPDAPSAVAVRPNFTTDFDLWLWVDTHPAEATGEDRLYLDQALNESPALRIQVEAELAKRSRQAR